MRQRGHTAAGRRSRSVGTMFATFVGNRDAVIMERAVCPIPSNRWRPEHSGDDGIMARLTRRSLLATASMASLMTLEQARAQGTPPKPGGTLTSLLTPEPAILIPGVNSQAPALLVQSKMYQSLLEFSPTLEPKPLLAKSWSLSDDKKTWTFQLQENVKFHDGTPMTADDVIFSIMKFHFTLAPRARGVFSKIKSATAPDPHTVVFTLDAPFDPFLLMFDVTTVAIMPKHIL